jgi:nucleotide-binding universal stress UspA family protein
MRVLCPTNFTPHSRQALAFALALAEKQAEAIALLHLYQLPIAEHRLTREELQQAIDQSRAEIMPRYQHLLMHLAPLPLSVSIEPMLKRGRSLAKAILQLSQNRDFSVVVMPYKNSKGLRSFFFGDEVQEIIENTKTPTLLIPENVRYSPIKHIVYATNFIGDNILALQQLDDFALLFDARITFLHVDDHVTANDKLIANNYRRALKKCMQSPHELLVLEQPKIPKAIAHYVNTEAVDVLVLLRKNHHLAARMFQNSITEAVLPRSIKPLLILQEEGTEGN